MVALRWDPFFDEECFRRLLRNRDESGPHDGLQHLDGRGFAHGVDQLGGLKI